MRKISNIDVSILLGNGIEHYDTALHGILAPILAPIFFPHKDPLVSLILTYAAFATGFLTKPMGALVFGLITKKKGAHTGLFYAIFGVAVFTALIGFLPSFATLGLLSPILLILLKTIRSLFIAGETTISNLYILANKSLNNAFKASIHYQTSTMGGIVLASALSTVVIYLDIKHLWRVTFWLGSFIGFWALYLRRKGEIIGSEQVSSLPTSTNEPMMHLFWQNKMIILRIAIANGYSYMTYFIPFVVMNSLIPMISDISLTQMMVTNTAFLIFDLLIIPFIGKYIIHFNPSKVMLFCTVVIGVSVLPLWYFITTSFYHVCFFRLWIVFWGCIYLCPLNLWKYQLVKHLGVTKYAIAGMGSTLGAILIGKTIAPLCFYLFYLTKHHLSIGIYIFVICLFTGITILLPSSKH